MINGFEGHQESTGEIPLSRFCHRSSVNLINAVSMLWLGLKSNGEGSTASSKVLWSCNPTVFSRTFRKKDSFKAGLKLYSTSLAMDWEGGPSHPTHSKMDGPKQTYFTTLVIWRRQLLQISAEQIPYSFLPYFYFPKTIYMELSVEFELYTKLYSTSNNGDMIFGSWIVLCYCI